MKSNKCKKEALKEVPKQFKLKKADKKKWVKALRSGKYIQGKRRLKYELRDRNNKPLTTYCCLGVAREIGLCRKFTNAEFVTAKWLPMRFQRTLSTKNDAGATFDDIANYIEENM